MLSSYSRVKHPPCAKIASPSDTKTVKTIQREHTSLHFGFVPSVDCSNSDKTLLRDSCTPHFKHTPISSSSQVGVSQRTCLCEGREWRKTNASSCHLHARALCHINPLSLWVYFSVKNKRLADPPTSPYLTPISFTWFWHAFKSLSLSEYKFKSNFSVQMTLWCCY